MTAVERALAYVRTYDGPPVRIMEVCGTHTAAIFKGGIRDLLSPAIRLVSGPGCPVCVTEPGYIDKLAEAALSPDTCVLTFADMLKVPGSRGSLQQLKGQGAQVRMLYSPFQAVEWAEREPDLRFVAAAVGFETTAPAWALAAEQALEKGLHNLTFLCALKTILPAVEGICQTEPQIAGFLCPGHVSTVIGAGAYAGLCEQYRKPMAVAGFEPAHILTAVWDILLQLEQGRADIAAMPVV